MLARVVTALGLIAFACVAASRISGSRRRRDEQREALARWEGEGGAVSPAARPADCR